MKLIAKVAPFVVFVLLLFLAIVAFFAGNKWTGAGFIILLIPLITSSIGSVPIGQTAELTWAGRRMDEFIDEGYFTIARFLLFGYFVIDSRDKVVRLQAVHVRSKDLVELEIPEIIVVLFVEDGDKFKELDPADLPGLVDDVVDVNVKSRVKGAPVEEAVLMELSTGEVEVTEELKRWGLGIRMIKVPDTPVPLDPKVRAALQLKPAEELEAKGEAVEIDHVIAQIAKLMQAGHSREQAITQVQASVNHANLNLDVNQVMTTPGSDAKLNLFIKEGK